MAFPYLTDLLNAVLDTQWSTQAEAISLVLVVAGGVGVLATLRTRRLVTKVAFGAAVAAALSACVPF